MADNVKQVILRDPKTNEILIPKIVGALAYEPDDSGELIPPYTNDADTLGGKTADQFATTEQLNELKTSVAEGKALVAAAVSDKGVETAADAEFATIAANVANIKTQIDINGIIDEYMVSAGSNINIGDFVSYLEKEVTELKPTQIGTVTHSLSVASGSSLYIRPVIQLNDNTVLIAVNIHEGSYSYKSYLYACTISNGNITSSSPVSISTTRANYYFMGITDIVKIDDSRALLMIDMLMSSTDSTTGYDDSYLYGVVAKVTNNVITLGSYTALMTGTSCASNTQLNGGYRLCENGANPIIMVDCTIEGSKHTEGSNSGLWLCFLTVSNMSVSASTPTHESRANVSGESWSSCYDSDNGYCIITYGDRSSAQQPTTVYYLVYSGTSRRGKYTSHLSSNYSEEPRIMASYDSDNKIIHILRAPTSAERSSDSTLSLNTLLYEYVIYDGSKFTTHITPKYICEPSMFSGFTPSQNWILKTNDLTLRYIIIQGSDSATPVIAYRQLNINVASNTVNVGDITETDVTNPSYTYAMYMDNEPLLFTQINSQKQLNIYRIYRRYTEVSVSPVTAGSEIYGVACTAGTSGKNIRVIHPSI